MQLLTSRMLSLLPSVPVQPKSPGNRRPQNTQATGQTVAQTAKPAATQPNVTTTAQPQPAQVVHQKPQIEELPAFVPAPKSLVWMQTGFAMVVLSAAIKAIPDEIIEAARIDGASELQVFWRIMVPTMPPRSWW